ncbi:MAG: LON peptidase substrate-binding domain-containing protein [Jatrophihabitans sp.]
MAEILPLFPLSHVLLPGMPLPLRIFEQRYRDLLADIATTPNGPAFGVVALHTGIEARSRQIVEDGVPDIEMVGTTAEILEIETDEDGTSELLAIGTRRFRILQILSEGKAYLRAEVEYLDEPDGALTWQQETRARELMDVYDAMLIKLAGRDTGADLPKDANQLSYQLAARVPLPPEERQELLTDDTTAERLVRISRLLRREIALLQGTRSIAVSPNVLRMMTGIN